MDKNELDKIFKAGLDNGPSNQYDEKQWKELEKRLDKKVGVSKLIVISMFSSAVAACLLIIFILNKNNLVENNPKEIATVKAGEDVFVAPNTQQIDVTNLDTVKNVSPSEDHSIAYILSPIKLPSSAEDQIPDSLGDSHSPVNERITDDKNQIVAIDASTDIKHLPKDSTVVIENMLTENDSKRDESLQAVKSEDIAVKPAKLKGSFAIIAALDLTKVKGAGQQKLSDNIGLLYTQPITKKLSMSAGALYSRKRYESPYSFYKPENPYKGSQTPTDVSAVCDVISVPVLVNYQILQSKSYTVTASTGLSTYFMLKEKYNFSYTGEGYNPYNTNYTVKGKNQHYFGVADFSVSFDRKINNKLSIGIRPFVQIPLTGIGFGRTNLQSKGVAVSFGIAP